MNLSQCLQNLKHDVNNGGLEEDSFAAICYVTMANEARRILSSGIGDRLKLDEAKEYLSVCCSSGVDSLRYIAGI